MKAIQRFFLFAVMAGLSIFSGCPKSEDNPTSSHPVPDYQSGDSTYVLVLSNRTPQNNWVVTNFDTMMTNIFLTAMNVSIDTPTVAYMETFDVVLLYEDGIFSQAPMVGDSVYRYVMRGGNLVLGTFYWQDRTDGGYSGSWGDLEMIDPIMGGACLYRNDSLGVILTYPLTNNVTKLLTYYRGGPDSLRAGATPVAWWADNTIFMAHSQPGPAPGGRITAVTTYPAEPYLLPSSGDYTSFFQIWENALRWSAWETTLVKAGISQKVQFTPSSHSRFQLLKKPGLRGGTGY